MQFEQHVRPTEVHGGTARKLRHGQIDVVGVGLAGLGLSLIGLSVVMIIAPGVFFDDVAPFGIRNDHYTIDGATFQLALGAGAVIAARIRSWRVPVLAILSFQFALHATNHLLDIDEADPNWLGTLNFVFLALGFALLVYLLARASSEGPRP